MYKSLSIFCLVSLLTLSTPAIGNAAEVTREKTRTNVAEANFLTNNDCEDVSVGVNITEKQDLLNRKENPTLTLLVFGSFVDNCEFGSSSSFFGTTTVTKQEFVQHGVKDAKLIKTFIVDGNEIHLNLIWRGVGVIGGEDEEVVVKETGTRIKKKWDVQSRNAEMNGVFIVNGLNRISDNSLVNAQLDVVKFTSKIITK